MKILVTGATGFIGKNLVKELIRKKHEVICLARKSSDKKNIDFLKNLGCKIYYGDITKKETLRKIDKSFDVVYHLAGLIGKANLNEKDYYSVNFEGTKNMLEICNKQKFIFLSTAGILGPVIFGNEKTSINPANLYEKTKAEADKLVLRYHNHIILRPGFIYGPYDKHALRLFRILKKSRFRFIIGNGKFLLQPAYIDDLIFCLIKCLDKKIRNEVFIVAGEKPISIDYFYRLVSKEFQVKTNRFKIPFILANAYVKITNPLSKIFGINPILTKGALDFLTKSRTFNINKSRKILGYNPIKLEEGIKKTIEWHKKNGSL